MAKSKKPAAPAKSKAPAKKSAPKKPAKPAPFMPKTF